MLPEERQPLSFPVRFGGLDIPIFAEIAERESLTIPRLQLSTFQLRSKARSLHIYLTGSLTTKSRKARKVFHHEKLDELRMAMSSDERRVNDLAQMKGASSWLTSLPMKSENYDINKREFHDGIRLRYR